MACLCRYSTTQQRVAKPQLPSVQQEDSRPSEVVEGHCPGQLGDVLSALTPFSMFLYHVTCTLKINLNLVRKFKVMAARDYISLKICT